MPPVPPAKFARTSKEGWSRKRSVSPSARAARVSPYQKNPSNASSSAVGVEAFVPCRSDDGLYYEDEYRDENIAYLLKMEKATLPQFELIDTQPEVKWHMRPYLIDFLVELHNQWRLQPECLYLTINIIDRYLSRRVVFKKHFQLVGCAALWIATKFEDSKDHVPLVREFYEMCCTSYDQVAFLQMESHILTTIGWVVGHPTGESWLKLHLTHSNSQLNDHPQVAATARFILEYTLYLHTLIDTRPSVLAWGSLILARFICGKQRRPAPHELLEPFESEAIHIAQTLDLSFHENVETMRDVLMTKYSHPRYFMCAESVRGFYQSGCRYASTPDYERTPTWRDCPTPTGLASPSPSWSARSFVSSSPGSRCSLGSDSGDEEESCGPITPNDPPVASADRRVAEAKENIAPAAVKLPKQVPGAPPTPTSYDEDTGRNFVTRP